MDESIGGAFMIKLLFVFIIIYVTFMCIAISYAKAFRIKNSVMNKLEQNQYVFGTDYTFIDDYLEEVSYGVDPDNASTVISNCGGVNFGSISNEKKTILTSKGVCIKQLGDDDNDGRDYYYKVTTYISIAFPFFGLDFMIPISGETKIIY